MIIFKNDEEKRSKAFAVITLAAIIVIVLIASFFLRKILTGDPLKGVWLSGESSLVLDFDGNGGLLLASSDEFGGEEIRIDMRYSLDRDSKLVSISTVSQRLDATVKDKPEDVDEEDIRAFAEAMAKSYEYSVDNEELTLMEIDGGDQKIFHKKQQ